MRQVKQRIQWFKQGKIEGNGDSKAILAYTHMYIHTDTHNICNICYFTSRKCTNELISHNVMFARNNR